MKDRTKLLLFIAVFLVLYFAPLKAVNLQRAILEAFFMLQEYAREHVLFCLIPAFFIAGAISIFISKDAVIKYFGAKANKALAYGVASVSGTILAVCSCIVLPMFAGIYTRGAGAISFSIIIGLLMSVFFKKKPDTDEELVAADTGSDTSRSLAQNGLYFLVLILILIFAAWAKPKEAVGFWKTKTGSALHFQH